MRSEVCWGPPTAQDRLHSLFTPPSAAWTLRPRRLVGPSRHVDRFGEGHQPFRRSRKMARLEAALLVAEHALPDRKLLQFAKLADLAEVRTLIEQLNLAYDRSRTAYRIERVATGYQMLTRPKFAPWLDRLHERQARLKLSAPMLETLSIVAYRQPITRADVEAIRGVQTSEMLKQLMERGLIRIVGEDDSLGRPYLYGTTRQFLESFGLQNLADMPLAERLRVQAVVAIEADERDAAARDGGHRAEASGVTPGAFDEAA
jgi:segregation and condensation protein B